ncbi:MAG: phospho-sugar mutase [Oscillospiraceae bacterium]|nr:phospho-sugar mutase [Oscillospiraceae bacterium]
MQNKITHCLQNADAQTVAELRGATEEELYDRFYKNIDFGTGGMRGLIGAGTNRINRYTVAKATAGYAEYIRCHGAQKRGVAIAYDNRRCSRLFAEITAGVLAAQGIKSYLFEDLRTTPELSFAVRHLGAFGGVVITASHNPPEYNGYKLYDETGCQMVPSLIAPIIQNINKIEDELAIPVLSLSEAGELIEVIGDEIDRPYYKKVLSLSFDPGVPKQIKVVYSPQHGTGNIPVRHVLKAAGFDVIPVESQCHPDPEFLNTRNPNPEAPEAFEAAIECMTQTGADLAITTDPDCDRLGVAVRHKDQFRLLSGNQSGAILFYYILNRRKEQKTLPNNGVMFTTVVTSSLGDKIAADFGVAVEKTLTGFKFIGDKIRQHELATEGKPFLFGYEESYGCLIGDFVRDKDAVQASLMLCDAADYYKKQSKTLVDVLDEIYGKYGVFTDHLTSVTLTGESGAKQIAKILADLRANPVDQIAGLKIREIVDFQNPPEGFPAANVLLYNFENGSFVAVRPSGTEPKCKFYYCVCGEGLDGLRAYFEGVCR